jgi:hypothetical protein
MFLCMEFISCSFDSNKPKIIENGVQMLKLLSFSCCCCYQFFGGRSLLHKTQSLQPRLCLLHSKAPEWPVAPETMARWWRLWHGRFWTNDWILGYLFKGPFFPNGSQMFLQVFSSICGLLELDNTHHYNYSCILFRETRDITIWFWETPDRMILDIPTNQYPIYVKGTFWILILEFFVDILLVLPLILLLVLPLISSFVDIAFVALVVFGRKGFEHLVCTCDCIGCIRLSSPWTLDMSHVSIIFDTPCLFMHHFICVLLHFVVFLCIFWN